MPGNDLPDQQPLWTAAYGARPEPDDRPSRFATACLDLLPHGASILELGCGRGADAAAFAHAGHTVVATDFVPGVLEANRSRHADLPGLAFREMRIDAPYPFADNSFDAVYAHLTLHYFRDAVTRRIVAEIHRVLRPGGWLLFACKSPQDPAHGRGIELEPDLFDLNGKVRHFFTEAYARDLLAGRFTDVAVTAHTGRLYRQRAGWITVVARAARGTTAASEPGGH